MVVVRKPNKLGLCLDHMHLNKDVIRNHYRTPTVEDIAPKLTKAKVFSVVDAKDGLLQVVLDETSSFLTTFWTAFGRYRWRRMPCGIKSAPEEFQRRLDECLEGLENVAVIHHSVWFCPEEKVCHEMEETDQEEAVFTDQRLEDVRQETSKDASLQTLMTLIMKGWPDNKLETPPLCK
ncbi:PREDICTED: uncharacterized protein K02A2.6-like [Acropora digitifera]|uniref:uncharacterized protein K02A2.6-like n=1 Tax=Acropora digitifera TaxID=70779 RepID=UPI00077ADCF1|nr:PREDICTED: uncharacterized protein K02A2.6-like [Acropora digitifera]